MVTCEDTLEGRINSASCTVYYLWYVFNWLVVLGAFALGYWGSRRIPWHDKRFSVNDDSISQKFGPDSVSSDALSSVSFLVPVVIFALVLYIQSIKDSGKVSTQRSRMMFYWWTFTHVSGLALTQAFTDTIKHLAQSLRPDFLERCFGNLANIPLSLRAPGALATVADCTTTDFQILNDGRLSFPSGHASMSIFASVFVVLFLHEHLHGLSLTIDSITQGWKYILYLTPLTWGVCVSFSRMLDFRHHVLDVLCGMALGAIFALLSRFFFAPNLSRDAFTPQGETGE